MENIFYVYEHIRNDTGKVFYVGKGHGKRAYYKNGRNGYWQNVVNKAGGFDVRFVIDKIDEEFAFLVEQELISKLKSQGVVLVNMTDGGDGTSGYKHTEEVKAIFREKTKQRMLNKEARDYLRKINLGKKLSQETVEKIRLSQIGKPSKMLGKKHSIETKNKISQSLIGNKRTAGHLLSNEHKRKLSEAMKDRFFSEEHRKKISASLKGYKHSEETRTKMSAAAIKREASRVKKEPEPKVYVSDRYKKLGQKLAGVKKEVVTCDVCGKSGGKPSMTRHHFKNCKGKKDEQ